jgi:hypothetical protein
MNLGFVRTEPVRGWHGPDWRMKQPLMNFIVTCMMLQMGTAGSGNKCGNFFTGTRVRRNDVE